MRRSSTSLGVELRQRRVGELLLDLPDVLLDPRRRGERLLVLQGGERRLVLLVGEVDADRARREQRARHQREDQQQVLAEQAAAMRDGQLPRSRRR